MYYRQHTCPLNYMHSQSRQENREYQSEYNDPTIGSYNNYHLSPNGMPSGNQRWYGLIYK